MYKISELYDLDHTLAKDYLAQFEYPWQALAGIKELILELGKNLGEDYVEVKEHVWVQKRKCAIVPLFVVVLWLGQIVLLEIVWN